MKKISVLMPAYNAAEYIGEAIESVLKQTFADFELIVADDGSTDYTRSVVRSFGDKRIILLENEHDFIRTLNNGLQSCSGKYVARMDSDDVMHAERLAVQYGIMEEEPRIAVCGTWSLPFGNNCPVGLVTPSGLGHIENPVIQLLGHNILFHPTVMLRKDFLDEFRLCYENYPFAEDYKLWFEIAKRGGVFFVESQALLYYRISASQVGARRQQEQVATVNRIKQEILAYLIKLFEKDYPEFSTLYDCLRKLEIKELLKEEDLFASFTTIFLKNKMKLMPASVIV